MEVNITVIISIISLIFAITAGVVNIRRNNKTDDKKEATALTTVIVKLENITNMISDLKRGMEAVREDVQNLEVRLVAVEQSAKQAHKRIDRLEGK